MISFGNAASSHSGLIPLKTSYKKRGELLWAIASKKNFINLHSAAFVTVFAGFQVSYARAHLAKSSKFASKRTLDYFRKKYPEYANNWLVSQIIVRAETVNVTAHLVGCNT